jgi:hypothetical protein
VFINWQDAEALDKVELEERDRGYSVGIAGLLSRMTNFLHPTQAENA